MAVALLGFNDRMDKLWRSDRTGSSCFIRRRRSCSGRETEPEADLVWLSRNAAEVRQQLSQASGPMALRVRQVYSGPGRHDLVLPDVDNAIRRVMPGASQTTSGTPLRSWGGWPCEPSADGACGAARTH